MKIKKSLNKNTSHILETKFSRLLEKRYPNGFTIFQALVLPKREFNRLTSFLRLTPDEFLAIAQGFKALKIRRHGTKWIKIIMGDESENR